MSRQKVSFPPLTFPFTICAFFHSMFWCPGSKFKEEDGMGLPVGYKAMKEQDDMESNELLERKTKGVEKGRW